METFSVEKSFILEAHKSACNDWKKRIEQQFPDAFPKKLTERIKSFDDILKISGKTESQVLPYRNPQNKNEIAINAYAKIQLVSEVLNDGWVADFNNQNEAKWYPWFEKKSSGWVLGSCGYCDCLYAAAGAGCFYKSEELALFAGKTFLDVYKEYLP